MCSASQSVVKDITRQALRGRQLKGQDCDNHLGVVGFSDFEIKAVGERTHSEIFRQDVGYNFFQIFIATHLDQAPHQFGAQTVPLVAVTN